MSFAVGFFGSLGNQIEERQKEVRKYRTNKREFLQTYGVQAVGDAKSKASGFVNTGMRLEALGLTRDNIGYIVETSGPQGLTEIYDRVKGLNNPMEPKAFNAFFNRAAKEFKPANASYEETINRAFGLYKANETDDPAENEKVGWFSSMLFDPKAGAGDLNIDGYSEADIRRIMGTTAPGLKAPLSVDFSKLPKNHSPSVLLKYADDQLKFIIREAERELANITTTGDAGKIAENVQKRKVLQTAINAAEYEAIIKLVPTIKNKIISFNTQTGGGLSNNPSFTSLLPNFFTDATEEIEGGSSTDLNATGSTATDSTATGSTATDSTAAGSTAGSTAGSEAADTSNSAYQVAHDLAVKQNPNKTIPPLNKIKRYPNAKAAGDSGEAWVIFDGRFHELDTGAAPTSAFDKDFADYATTTEPPLNETQGDAFLRGMTEGPAYLYAANKAIGRAMLLLPKSVIEFWNSPTAEGESRSKLVKTQTDLIAGIMTAKEEGASEEDLATLEAELVVSIDTLPEDLQKSLGELMKKVDKEKLDLNDNKIPTATEEAKGWGDWWRGLGSKPEGTLERSEPQDVRDMGNIPFTQLQPLAFPKSMDMTQKERDDRKAYFTTAMDSAIEFQSFDDLKEELKSGTLRQGSVVRFRYEYYTVDQSGTGAVGDVDIVPIR